MNLSLHGRIVLAATLILTAFLGITGMVLDKAFRDSAETALKEKLQGQLYALLAAADPDARGRMQLEDLPDPRLAVPGSGLYAEIVRTDGSHRWRSPSAVGRELDFKARPATGRRAFETLREEDGGELRALSMGVAWRTSGGRQLYLFRTAESLAGYYAQIHRFRRSLWLWLGGGALLLLLVQGLILRWGLAPLRRVAADLRAIEAGRARRLSGTYPRELRGLTDNLNALVESAENRLRRQRESLADLAHSLKTPLAVLRNTLETPAPDAAARAEIQAQLTRMTQIVDYQLQRAGAAGRSGLATPVDVAAKARQVNNALDKVYRDKGVRCELEIPAGLRFHGDEGDLLELLGNLLDNAYKWCRQRVMVRAQPLEKADGPPGLELCVEDDGPGIPAHLAEQVLRRGTRADPRQPGQGIGLAVVRDLARAYGGEVRLETGALGGARVCTRLH